MSDGARPRAEDGAHARVAGAALAVAAALALGLPPEVRPLSGAIVALLLGAGLLLAQRGPTVLAALAGAGALAAHLALSVAPGRSLETAAALVLPVAALLLARRLPREAAVPLLAAVAAVGAALGVLALAQKGGILEREALLAAELGLPEEMILRLQRGRAFATHVVPAALGGALVTALFAAGALAERTGRRGLPACFAALSFAGLAASASVGALLALGAGGAAFAALRLGRRARIAIPAGALVLVLLVALATQMRALPVFDLDHPNSPIALRAGNWRGAALVGAERPVTGVGLGAFGAVYPSVRRPADSETIYAHNSWLQLAAEGGLPAVLLLAIGAALAVRRLRREDLGGRAWVLSATAAFLAHNLVDFTLYLPGVAVPAMALAGLAFPARRTVEHAQRRPLAWGGAVVVAVLLAGTALVFVQTSSARATLGDAAVLAIDGEPDESLRREAFRAAHAAPWSTRLATRAGTVLLSSPRWHAAALALAERAVRIDPWSPEGWHLLARARLARRDVVGSWRAYDRAARRHPADSELAERRDAIGAAIEERGLLARPLAWGGERPVPRVVRAFGWDTFLLLMHVAAAALVLARRLRHGGPAPPELLGLCLVVLLSVWVDGGALPGARAGRHLLAAATLIAALWPRRDAAGRDRDWSAGPLLWLLPVAVWGALAASFAPDGAASRDGLVAFVTGLALLALSRELSERYPAWPRVLRAMIGVAAGGAAATWLVQRAGVALGADAASWPGPFATEPLRPAGDFLHPGHLGTYLVAAGLLYAGSALGTRRGARVAWGAALIGILFVSLGLLPGARASMLALAAGGAALVVSTLLTMEDRRLARRVAGVLAAALVVAGVVGALAISSRFADTDRYAYMRLAIWPAAIEAAADRPWTGFGPAGFAAVAPSYAVEDPGAVARWGRVWRGPHSDLIAAVLLLGVPGALLLFAAIARFARPAVRALRTEPLAPGIVAALAAISAHALVDDLFTERPAIAVMAVLLFGALAGRAPWHRDRAVVATPGPVSRALVTVALVTGLFAGELVPYAAWRASVAGEPEAASRLDPRRVSFLVASAHALTGDSTERVLAADDLTEQAARLAPLVPAVRTERARMLTAACFGPLPEQRTCGDARAAWSAQLALRPADAGARRARARIALAVGDPRDGVSDLLLALDAEPNFLGARDDLAATYDRLGLSDLAASARAEQSRRIEALEGHRPQNDYERMLLTRPRRPLPAPPGPS